MRRFHAAIALILFTVFAASFAGMLLAKDPLPPATPFMRRVDPASVRAGEMVTAFGDALDKTRVHSVYLTDGKNDLKMEIVSQAESSIQFKVPATTAVGRYSLMVLLAGPDPKFIEQPVYLTVIGQITGQ